MNEVKYLSSLADAETIDETEPPPEIIAREHQSLKRISIEPEEMVALNQLARVQTGELDTIAAIVQVAVAPAASNEEEVGEQSTAEVVSGSSIT